MREWRTGSGGVSDMEKEGTGEQESHRNEQGERGSNVVFGRVSMIVCFVSQC